MRRTGGNRLSLSCRLGITLVILGMVQSLAPPCFWPARASLRVMGPLEIAVASLDLAETPACPIANGPALSSQPGQDPESESDQESESQDSEELAETFVWAEAVTVRRAVHRFAPVALLGSIPEPGRSLERTQSALQASRATAILAATSEGLSARLCRLTC